jgi:uncharacterized protein (TIGR02246 family)
MRSSHRTLAIALVSGAMAACTAADTGPVVDLAAEEAAIRDLSAQWMASAQGQDAAAIADLFTAGGTTIFDGEMVMGPPAIQASSQADFDEQPDAVVSWTTNSVTVAASGDMAYERGAWTSDPDGPGDLGDVHGEYVTVWVKVDGAWKVAVDAGTTIQPAGYDDDEEGAGEHEDDGDM